MNSLAPGLEKPGQAASATGPGTDASSAAGQALGKRVIVSVRSGSFGDTVCPASALAGAPFRRFGMRGSSLFLGVGSS